MRRAVGQDTVSGLSLGNSGDVLKTVSWNHLKAWRSVLAAGLSLGWGIIQNYMWTVHVVSLLLCNMVSVSHVQASQVLYHL